MLKSYYIPTGYENFFLNKGLLNRINELSLIILVWLI